MLRLLLILILLFSASCKELKNDVDQWAKKNSLRGPQGGEVETKKKFTSVCPKGSSPDKNLSSESKKMCKTKSGLIFPAADAFQEFYSNGNPKTLLVYSGDNLLRLNWYENGRQKDEIQYRNNKKDGPFKEWYEEGTPKELGTYIAGKKNGVFKSYYSSNKIKEIANYVLDQKNGIVESYNQNGKLISRETFKSDIKVGNSEYLDPETGKINSHGTYANNEYDGRWVSYHKNGQVSSFGQYTNGKKNGEWKYFDEYGKQTQTEYFQNGIVSKKFELKANVAFNNSDQMGATPPEYQVKNRIKNSKILAPPTQQKSGWQSM